MSIHAKELAGTRSEIGVAVPKLPPFAHFLPLVVLVFSLFIGRYPLDVSEVLAQVYSFITTGTLEWSSPLSVLWYVRLPRAVLVLAAGGALALAGTVLQGLFRNPLVSPEIIGVTSGASLGAALAIVVWGSSAGGVQVWAFLGGLVAVAAAYNLANVAGRNSVVSLVLAGIIVNALATSGVSLLKYFSDPYQDLPALEFWLMGGFFTADWGKLAGILPTLLAGSAVIILLRWKVNILSLGEEEALTLGVRVNLIRVLLVGAATVIVAAVVSVAGMVSWIGLVAPHVVRFMVGNNHVRTLPLSISIGGALLLVADTLARTVTASEIPISIVTSLVGAPFLGYLLLKVGNEHWNR